MEISEIEMHLIEKYYQQVNRKSKLPSNCLIHLCDGHLHHGGLADRLRGIVSAYRFCKETHRPFRIGFFEPFDLREYFLPNLYDWNVEKSDIIYDLSLSIPKVIRCITENNDELCLHRKRFYSDVKSEVRQIHLYSNSLCFINEFQNDFNELFRPSSNLCIELKKIESCLGNDYESVSLRFGNWLGDFPDIFNPLTLDKQVILLNQVNELLERLANSVYKRGNKLLVTSDSQRFISQIGTIPNTFLICGPIVHSNNSKDEGGIMKVFLEFMTISQAKSIWSISTKEMYKGSFAKIAALSKGKLCNQYE